MALRATDHANPLTAGESRAEPGSTNTGPTSHEAKATVLAVPSAFFSNPASRPIVDAIDN
jgi:hypothetical protein